MGWQTAGAAGRTPAIGALSADGVAEEHRQKIDNLIAAKTLPRKAHLLVDQASNTVCVQMPADHDDFSKPRWSRDVGLRRRLDFHQPISDTGHTWTSLLRTIGFFLNKEAHFYASRLPITPRCASRGRCKEECWQKHSTSCMACVSARVP